MRLSGNSIRYDTILHAHWDPYDTIRAKKFDTIRYDEVVLRFDAIWCWDSGWVSRECVPRFVLIGYWLWELCKFWFLVLESSSSDFCFVGPTADAATLFKNIRTWSRFGKVAKILVPFLETFWSPGGFQRAILNNWQIRERFLVGLGHCWGCLGGSVGPKWAY